MAVSANNFVPGADDHSAAGREDLVDEPAMHASAGEIAAEEAALAEFAAYRDRMLAQREAEAAQREAHSLAAAQRNAARHAQTQTQAAQRAAQAQAFQRTNEALEARRNAEAFEAQRNAQANTAAAGHGGCRAPPQRASRAPAPPKEAPRAPPQEAPQEPEAAPSYIPEFSPGYVHALASLKELLGGAVADQALHRLLIAADGDENLAANIFFEGG
mmetsp:Transcript_22811/g.54540  ORF Transcript_22811/g.54540 Transcript_22811/m.54540 type:complete len:216 (+) Transcript_22811:395-1042(+)